MKLLYCDWNSFCRADVLQAFENLGHTYKLFSIKDIPFPFIVFAIITVGLFSSFVSFKTFSSSLQLFPSTILLNK